MKKVFIVMMFAIGLTAGGNTLYAQDSPNEFYLGYGPGAVSMQSYYETTNDVLNGLFSGIFSSDDISNDASSIGIFSVGFNRFISEKFKLGLNASYASYTNTQDYKKNGTVVKSIKWTDDFWTFMVRADFHYMKKENITLYSGLALGASFVNSKEGSGAEGLSIPDNTSFAFQINAFGIRVGKGFAFFAETGFGYLGMLNAGFNIRF